MREPSCSPLCIWVQHRHRGQEELASFLWVLISCPQEAILEAAKLGSLASWSPLSYPYSGTRAGTKTPRGQVIHMLFTLILDPSVQGSVCVPLRLSGHIFQTKKVTPW